MAVQFEWDQRKAASNLRKHGVSFSEASTVFRDPLAVIFDDETHSAREYREIIIGHSTRGRLLLVCFTERAEDTIRISVHGRQPKWNEKIMKKTEPSKPADKEPDEMLNEYKFDYSKARPNRFAARMKESVTVTLDSDVAEVFTTSESVNTVLRALIETMPKTKGTRRIRKQASNQQNS